MKPILALVAMSVLSWVAAALLVDRGTSIAILFGMLGPLFSVTATWVLAGWVYQRNPTAMTAFMMTAFAAKMVFFGGYVAVMLRLLSLRPVPFVVSFTSYFIVLYAIEALHLRRLFWGGMRASR